MSLVLVTPPGEEPVTLAQARVYLKVDASDEDEIIAALITAARIRAEWFTGRAFVEQSWTYWMDAWPSDGIVDIPLVPLIRVASVTTYADDDGATTVDAATYLVDTASLPGRIALKNALSPPVVNLRSTNAVAVNFSAGYGDAGAVPAPIAQAILCIVADLFANRGDADVPVGARAQALLAPYRMLRL